MNFTREPIIETVITPREGCKLVIRSSKGDGEDYFVDAVEVISFGNALFFRSLERPKSFLLPVSDYEVLELKETRMVLKNVSSEKSIKINGSKKEEASEEQSEKSSDRKKRRSRRRKMSSERKQVKEEKQESDATEEKQEKESEPTSSEGIKNQTSQPSMFTRLFPPPPTLIKEKLSRAKQEPTQEDVLARDVEEPVIPEDASTPVEEIVKTPTLEEVNVSEEKPNEEPS
ncbi:MAG: hypothetical protein COT84_08430 [Chlamydiae bacterium CG10_big_fil_rev_8_21_14_0_10_35_9]|nr:MAG: hypothetical protein COT84_08430 [Chlamydiae bacterium CG10_big_fil_rev_8_21_14_0_10_35_9]